MEPFPRGITDRAEKMWQEYREATMTPDVSDRDLLLSRVQFLSGVLACFVELAGMEKSWSGRDYFEAQIKLHEEMAGREEELVEAVASIPEVFLPENEEDPVVN